jgi:hypothetical protein
MSEAGRQAGDCPGKWGAWPPLPVLEGRHALGLREGATAAANTGTAMAALRLFSPGAAPLCIAKQNSLGFAILR